MLYSSLLFFLSSSLSFAIIKSIYFSLPSFFDFAFRFSLFISSFLLSVSPSLFLLLLLDSMFSCFYSCFPNHPFAFLSYSRFLTLFNLFLLVSFLPLFPNLPFFQWHLFLCHISSFLRFSPKILRFSLLSFPFLYSSFLSYTIFPLFQFFSHSYLIFPITLVFSSFYSHFHNFFPDFPLPSSFLSLPIPFTLPQYTSPFIRAFPFPLFFYPCSSFLSFLYPISPPTRHRIIAKVAASLLVLYLWKPISVYHPKRHRARDHKFSGCQENTEGPG